MSAETEAHPAAAVPRRKRSIAPLVIAGSIAVIGLAVLGTSTSGGAGMYNYSLAELQGKLEQLAGKDVKVAGRIARGSVRGEPASESFRFELEDDDGNKLAIGYRKLLPDPFEEGREAIVQGRIEAGVQMTPEQRETYYETDYRKHAATKAGEAK